MGNFNRGERSGGGRSFGGKPTLHKAVCSKCRKECEVPFRPTGNKPVFCRDCFRNEGSFSRPNFESPQYPQYKEQFEALNIKLDKILKILTPVASVEEQAVIPEKKKRVSKKAALTPEEKL